MHVCKLKMMLWMQSNNIDRDAKEGPVIVDREGHYVSRGLGNHLNVVKKNVRENITVLKFVWMNGTSKR